jgi:RNA polymerase sigma-70 factor (ECF subfamily)
MKPPAPQDPSNPTAEERSASGRAGAGDDPDRPLVARARQGDLAAFRELVDRHRDRAYALALRVLRSEPDAEEVAQDAFVRAWRALPGFRGESRFGTWLYAIVMRRAIDRAATLRGRRTREVDLDAAAEQTASSNAGPAREQAQLALRLERLLGRLSEAQRAVVTLFYYEERSVEEVSRTLGMPTGTVKTHLSRARAALRDAWRRGPGGEAAP